MSHFVDEFWDIPIVRHVPAQQKTQKCINFVYVLKFMYLFCNNKENKTSAVIYLVYVIEAQGIQ